MSSQFHFAEAFWFRVPLKALVLTVCVFGLVSLYPALTDGTSEDHRRAIFGFIVVIAFVTMGAIFAVAINDSYVELDDRSLYIRFESFFQAEIPVREIVRVSYIAPRPTWRYRFGLSTNFEDRISCSHGGRLVEIVLARPWHTRLWPRDIAVTRFWIAVREHEELVERLRDVAPRAFAPASLASAA